jgi:protein-S-isoprenylcysteine O-methyltransferase Ste14
MNWLEHRIPPPLIALLCAVAMSGLAQAYAAIAFAPALRFGAAFALFALGLASAIAGIFAFWRSGANIDPHKIDRGEVLVTTGVYRFTRNPMYLGMALVLCGYAFYLARPLAVLGPAVFALYITRFQILPEERAMLAKFGQTYTAYRSATRRWI